MTLAFLSIPYSTSPIWILAVIILIGFVGLTLGGDWLTEGAVAISMNLKINPVVVGLTIVSVATSMPELMASLFSAKDNPGLAIGNILGSNVANIGLILGVTAFIAPLRVQLRLVQREVPMLIGITLLFTVFAIRGFSRMEGIFLLSLAIIYLVLVVYWAKKESAVVTEEFAEEEATSTAHSTKKGVFFILLGAVVLALGADVLIGSCVEVAGRMGVSDVLIGLTVVAIGTSLPELAASVAAARSGHSDICAGNIVGSNIFNILLIGGGVATIVPIRVDPGLLLVEFPAFVLLTLLLLQIFKTGHIVTRREGVLLLFLYVAILSLSALSQLGYFF